jgi:hypothetical protein
MHTIVFTIVLLYYCKSNTVVLYLLVYIEVSNGKLMFVLQVFLLQAVFGEWVQLMT